MKKLILLSIVIISCSQLLAQDFETFSRYFGSRAKLNDVLAITTSNDFNQKPLTIAEIDAQISKKLTGDAVINYEIPINSKKLKYLGRMNPKKAIPFHEPSFDNDMKMVNKELEVFRYDDVYILVEDRSNKNLLNVFFASRAVHILKEKYPTAYNYLLKPDQIELGYKKYRARPVLTKLIPIISFDKSPTKIAGSLWNLVLASEKTVEYEGQKAFLNTLNGLTSINYETARPKEIYGDADEMKNYWYYLREGLIESIVHEFTHLYIANFKFFDPKAAFLFEKRSDVSDATFSGDAEEAIVINTTESYFIKHGGLSKRLIDFNVKEKYEPKKAILSDMSKLVNKTRFDALKAVSPASSSTFDEVYRLDFLSSQTR